MCKRGADELDSHINTLSHSTSSLWRYYFKKILQGQRQTSGAIQYGEPLLDLTSFNFVAWEGKRTKIMS